MLIGSIVCDIGDILVVGDMADDGEWYSVS